MEGENGVTGGIIDDLHSSDVQRDQMEGERVLLEVSLIYLIFWIFKEIKWMVKAGLLELSLMNFILRISK